MLRACGGRPARHCPRRAALRHIAPGTDPFSDTVCALRSTFREADHYMAVDTKVLWQRAAAAAVGD